MCSSLLVMPLSLFLVVAKLVSSGLITTLVDFVAVDAAVADNDVDHFSVPTAARDSSDHCFCVGRDYKKALLSTFSYLKYSTTILVALTMLSTTCLLWPAICPRNAVLTLDKYNNRQSHKT